jgi:hypothetical protein
MFSYACMDIVVLCKCVYSTEVFLWGPSWSCTKCMGKFFDCYCCNCRGERRGQGHTSASLLHQSATWHCPVNMHCFYTSAFSTSCFVLSAMDGKIEQRVCIKFRLRLRKSATKTLQMLREAFGEYSLRRTAVFEWHSRFKAGRVSAKDNERSGRPSTSITR